MSQAPKGMWKGVRTMTFADGWRTLKLCMFDESQKRLISMEEFDRLYS